LIRYQKVLGPTRPLHFANRAERFSVDRLDSAADKLPVKELVFL
jgi:hypothetical protein